MSLALVLAACGGSDSTDSSDSSNSSGGEEASSSEAPPSSAAAGGNGGDKNGGDKEAACTEIRQTIQQITTSGNFDDPDALAQTYFDGATAVEASGDESGDDEVRSAADRTASALRELGEVVKARSTIIPDSGPLTKAGVDLQSACT